MNSPVLETGTYDVARVRADFPILSREVYGKPLVYLDNAASAQKPRSVIDAVTDAYSNEYSNVHRGMHYLSNAATEKFEQARETARRFLNATSTDEIVFTSGATDAINLVASSFAEPGIKPGDEIILSVMEHHSNIVPWHFLRERHGAVLKYVPVTDEGDLDIEAYGKLFSSRTKMVALTQMSNALGTITPIKAMIRTAHEHGVPVLVDGCQGVVHMPTDVRDLDCDFLVCSGHKLYGPTGIGLLYGKIEHLKAMRPYRGGGEMIREVGLDNITYAAPPHRFEAGTPAIVQAIGLGAALSYIESVGRDNIAAHEAQLRDYATRRLSEINSLHIIGTTKSKGSIVSFVIENAHPHDIATVIDRAGVAVRAGHHCAQPVMERFGVGATTRASFAMYNTLEEVDRLAEALIDSKKFFG
ncbi:MAG: cysteine desulfurase [Parvibaculum sp.]|uniref:cysteine desulfurase n=1 Tax=Parvibaculum sp. TaxID=2024848 RepID=UPI00272FB92C|nr:cysteine desulfurase [Parvibaculum sp.]MDP1627877.1 cysteine desulfurase [Parvibaculum sp.]MDP2150875.1 cysteine desulfurase [Parvibaculum sp.]